MTSTEMQRRIDKLQVDITNLLVGARKDLPANVQIALVREPPYAVRVTARMETTGGAE